MDTENVAELVNRLVRRLLFAGIPGGESDGSLSAEANVQKAYRYAIRIIGSRIAPSLAADEAAEAEAIKKEFVAANRPSDAMHFAELHRRLVAKPGMHARWALLHALRVISNDKAREMSGLGAVGGAALTFTSTLVSTSSVGGNASALANAKGYPRASAPSTPAHFLHRVPGTGPPGSSALGPTPASARQGFEPSAASMGTGANASFLNGASVMGGGLPVVAAHELMVLDDNVKVTAYREYLEGERTQHEVSESALVRDVVFTCQAIDGRHIRWDEEDDAYVVDPKVGVPRATRDLLRRLCELGWLYRRVKAYADECLGAAPPPMSSSSSRGGGATAVTATTIDPESVREGVGLVGQSFGAALQRELAEYFRLLAVLESQAHLPSASVPGAGGWGSTSAVHGGTSNGYLSLRRLAVWLAEPLHRMRTMAVIVDSTRGAWNATGGGTGAGGVGIAPGAVPLSPPPQGQDGSYLGASASNQPGLPPTAPATGEFMRGGGLASAIHAHTRHGDPGVRSLVTRLLRQTCVPLFEMLRRWMFEGELVDPYREFFVVADPDVADENMWHARYSLDMSMLPSFIPESLAQRILRIGKSINFLRVCCQDPLGKAGVKAAAAAATVSPSWGLAYGQVGELEAVVKKVAEEIDRRLLETMFGERYRFMDHFGAIRRYLLLGQGDFIQHLMDMVGSDLNDAASAVSAFKLMGTLEAAIRASNSVHDDADILGRLRVKMMPHSDGDLGWDVFSLEYTLGPPLSTVFTSAAMAKYLRVFNFLWRLKRVEHALAATWHTMKPNTWTRLRGVGGSSKGGAGGGGGVTGGRVQGGRRGSGGTLPTRGIGDVESELLRRNHALRNEMIHFVTNLEYYIMFEVLECSSARFSADVAAAGDLGALIDAHEHYLETVLAKSLLSSQDFAQALSHQLTALFDLILRFKGLSDRIYQVLLEEPAARRGRHAARAAENERRGQWGDSSALDDLGATASAVEGLRVQMDAVAGDYARRLEGFLTLLLSQANTLGNDIASDLKFLAYRLDFSEYYRRQSEAGQASLFGGTGRDEGDEDWEEGGIDAGEFELGRVGLYKDSLAT
eukprot:jgi/Mesvir1/3757/Mv15031-RA.1